MPANTLRKAQERKTLLSECKHKIIIGISKRFKINMRSVSTSSKNKLSTRFQDIDRLFVCRKTKEQRSQMGKEYDDVKLTDIYCKANPNKILQKYGRAVLVKLAVTHEGDPTVKRLISWNPDYKPAQTTPEEELEEEKLLDEQKLFQTLHEQLQELQKRFGKTTEQMSELFLQVCGDLEAVESELLGKSEKVVKWNYLEDLALNKAFESTEFQWLLKLKGQAEIDKRKRFLLSSGDKDEKQRVQGEDDEDDEMEDDDEVGDVKMKEEGGGNEWGEQAVGYC